MNTVYVIYSKFLNITTIRILKNHPVNFKHYYPDGKICYIKQVPSNFKLKPILKTLSLIYPVSNKFIFSSDYNIITQILNDYINREP
jgi:hypothetical protein